MTLSSACPGNRHHAPPDHADDQYSHTREIFAHPADNVAGYLPLDCRSAPVLSTTTRRYCAHFHGDDVEIRMGSLANAPTGLMPMQEGWTIRREPG
jgi:hypothetical protein